MSDQNEKPASVNAGQSGDERLHSEPTVTLPETPRAVNLALRGEVAKSVLGEIDWIGASQGFPLCPQFDNHASPQF